MNKLFFQSLGCDKNLSDSEHMLSLLQRDGFVLTDDETEADVAVVNTCCFIEDAMQESIDALITLGELKKEGTLSVLIAAGCLAERFGEQFADQLPEVDGFVGTNAWDKINDAIHEALEGKRPERKEPFEGLPHVKGRLLSTGGHFAYLKIAEGCDKGCTYCIIPKIRGRYRSIPMEELVSEAEELAASGVSELIIVAQEITRYGMDLYGEKSLPKLLAKLCGIDGIRWIRLLYAYPEEIDDGLIRVMKNEPKICRYLDMPIQHCNDEILRKMGRHATKAQLVSVIEKLRESIPGIALRTTLISGFPGETEDQHRELLGFVEEMRFDRLGVFCYSPEEGTPAAGFDGQIEDEVKKQRREELMLAQQDVTFSINETLVGKTLTVFVEGEIPQDGVIVARSYRDAPEIDGLVFVESVLPLVSGQFAKVKITGTHEYDLIGEISDEPAE